MATTKTTPGATTVRVATQTGAAKDDLLSSAMTGLSEDHVRADLNVLSNDPGAARVYSLFQDAASLPSGSQFPLLTSVQLVSGAVISINADGTIGYDASAIQAVLQSYAAGEEFTDTFLYTARMANGALSTATVSVKIAGVNDIAVISGTNQGSVSEDNVLAANGLLTVFDADHDQSAFAPLNGSQLAATYGDFNFDNGAWTYSLRNDAGNVQSLAAGDVVTDTLTVTSLDGSASETISVIVNGTNDIAVISGTNQGLVSEDNVLAANGLLTVFDADHDQSAFAPLNGSQLAATYGDFSFDNGAWTYSLRNDAGNVQSLAAGDVVTDTLTVTSLDGSTSETISVNVNGTNDIAMISGNASGAVFEDGVLTTGGKLTVNDLDHGQSLFETDDLILNGNYGNFTFDADGNWTYSLNNSNDAVQALNNGHYLIDSLVVGSLDGSANETINITINGANEPVTTVSPTLSTPVNPVTDFRVNHGLTDQNGRQFFNGFDNNDRVIYSNNYEFVANSIHHIDVGNDGIIDSTADFLRNQGDHVTIVLVGYEDLTPSQIVAA